METSRSAEDGSELLMSTETLGCDSPVMWPDQNFCKFIIKQYYHNYKLFTLLIFLQLGILIHW